MLTHTFPCSILVCTVVINILPAIIVTAEHDLTVFCFMKPHVACKVMLDEGSGGEVSIFKLKYLEAAFHFL